MKEYCVILPIRTGESAKVLGNKVFYCEQFENDQVKIFDDYEEKVINIINKNKCKIVDRTDFKRDASGAMWLI